MIPRAAHPVAIIDIGSNSVRLVILDRLSRSPWELCTEQIYPHLGRRIARTGRLDPEGVQICLEGLRRFGLLCDGWHVGNRIVVATAAVRDASDGAAFIREVKQYAGLDVEIIGGKEEGRLSALGVISGIPGADGLVGDLGGGSLELAMIGEGEVRQSVTLPLGPFRLQQKGNCRTDRETLVRFIDKELSGIPWLEEAKGRDFHAVGGNWRAIAKAQMQRDQYPLNIVHQHMLGVRQGIDIAQFLSIAPPSSLVRHAVPKKRVELVPYAALVMERVLTLAKPRSLIFSGYGLRDGLVYDRLDARERAKDPLLAACAHLVGSPAYGEHVFHWSSTLFAAETSEQARLRHAACLLSEVGARDHAVHRAESAYERVLYMQSGGLDHAARAFLAYTLYRRNEGPADTRAGKAILNTVEQLIATPALRAAERIGAVLDFAGTFSGGVAALLDRAELSISEGTLILTCDEQGMSLLSETIGKQFSGLAKHLHLTPVVRQS